MALQTCPITAVVSLYLLASNVAFTFATRVWDDEQRLMTDLFDNSGYNPLIRPVNNSADVIDINFGIDLNQIISVDEKNQVMKSNLWLSMTWIDQHMKWNKHEYGGISKIRVNHDKVWKPDIVLFNNFDGKYEPSFMSQVVIYDYQMLWVPPAIYKSTCSINVEYFPFDQQECELRFGSWTFNAKELRLKFKYPHYTYADITNYKPSQVWDIIDCPAEIITTNDTDPPQQYMVFKLVMRRKSLFYTCNLILPCVLISMLSIAVFFLPAHSGEKITLSISILFALVVFVLLISSILPPAASVPLLAKYLFVTFVSNIVSVIISVFIINWNFRSPQTHVMPVWIKIVFIKYLPKVLLMERPDHKERYGNSRKHDQIKDIDASKTRRPKHVSSSPAKLNEARTSGKPSDNFLFSPEARATVKSVGLIADHMKQEDEIQAVKDDWIFVAAVVDRGLLYVWLLLTIAGTFGTILTAPHVFESIDQEKVKRDIIQKM